MIGCRHVGRQVAVLGAGSHIIYKRIVNIFISSGGIYVTMIFIQVIIYALGMVNSSLARVRAA